MTAAPPNKFSSAPPCNFVALILTNGRPDRVITYKTLRRCGYTGPIRLVIDDLDPKRAEYVKEFGEDQVVIFDKKKTAETFDTGDNFNDMRAIVYARNASFDIAEKLGFKYFIQLDDDYTAFHYYFDENLNYIERNAALCNLDRIFSAMLEFFISTPSISSIAFAQSGDYIGGKESPRAKKIMALRKCMNSFLCSTERRFTFIGRINEDVNTYTHLGSTGLLMFTTNQFALKQKTTQTNAGGMTELYKDSGTYLKSFYSVMYQPSSVKIGVIRGDAHHRIHHAVSWRNTTPKIVSEDLRRK